VAAEPIGGDSVPVTAKKRKRVPRKPSKRVGHQSPTPAPNAPSASPGALASNMDGSSVSSERPSAADGL
jgi:hypothetical protein